MNNGQEFQDFLKFVTKQDWRRLLPLVAIVLIALVVGALTWGWWFFFVGLLGYALFYYVSFRAMYRNNSGNDPGAPATQPFDRSMYDLSPLQGKYREFMERAI